LLRSGWSFFVRLSIAHLRKENALGGGLFLYEARDIGCSALYRW
jgi:hypothetical protein